MAPTGRCWILRQYGSRLGSDPNTRRFSAPRGVCPKRPTIRFGWLLEPLRLGGCANRATWITADGSCVPQPRRSAKNSRLIRWMMVGPYTPTQYGSCRNSSGCFVVRLSLTSCSKSSLRTLPFTTTIQNDHYIRALGIEVGY